jgi:Carboxypeptidase regulatory-like domain
VFEVKRKSRMKPACSRRLRMAGFSVIILLVSATLFGCGAVVNSAFDPRPTPQGINGTVVDHATGQPVGGANVILEQPDPKGVDRVIATTTTASNGSFDFSGLQPGNYDVVADASVTLPTGVTNTYAATITFRVPSGTAVNGIPLVPEFGDSIPSGQPVQIGAVVATSSSTATPPQVDIKLSALQTASVDDGTPVSVTIPVFAGSTPEVTTSTAPGCPSGASCSNYTLLAPSSDPVAGTFHTSGVMYAIPAPDPAEVIFFIEGRAFVHGSANASDCSPPSQTSGQVVPRGTLPTVNPNLAFTSCQ